MTEYVSPEDALKQSHQPGKKREAKFETSPSGRAAFAEAIAAWMESGEPLEDFFREQYDITQTTVYTTSKRLGVPIPTNRKLPREEILWKQQHTRTPPAVIAARYGITTGTLRQWSARYSMPLKGNTKWQRTKWWKAFFEGLDDLDNAFAYFAEHKVAPHLAIAAYHELFAPDHPICWDASDDPPVVITDWEDQDFVGAVNDTEAVPPEQAKIFIGLGKLVHYVKWPEPIERGATPMNQDPNEINVDGELVTAGARLWILGKNDEFREVEYLGLQENQLARIRDIETGRKSTTSSGALCLERPEDGKIPPPPPVED